MKKLFLVGLMTVASVIHAQSIPNEYHGEWAKQGNCVDYAYAIIDKHSYTPDNDWGMAKITKMINNKDGSLTLMGVESFSDEGQIFKSNSKITLKLIGDTLNVKGLHHSNRYNTDMKKCSVVPRYN